MEPIMHRVPAYKLWLVWLGLAMAVLIANPWGVFGWDAWFAAAVPLLLVHPAVHPLGVLVFGSDASALVWSTLGDQSGGWPELAYLWCVLFIGTAVGAFARRDNSDAQSRFEGVYPISNGTLFFDALNRELYRARRDGRSFAVLSVDRQVGHSDTSLRRVHELLNAEMRTYADIAQFGERVLVLVPEVRGEQHEKLLRRLRASAQTTDCGEIRIGLARFPMDAVCAEDLIAVADRKRLADEPPRISSVHASARVAS